tara:strand:+ start:723 stop:944 length:222 start_codon:yes stop_codon:yes gene_type:complete
MPAKSLSQAVSEQNVPKENKQPNVVDEKIFNLSSDEVKFILAKLAQIEFKGVEIEFTYNLIVKLQEYYKILNK